MAINDIGVKQEDKLNALSLISSMLAEFQETNIIKMQIVTSDNM